MGDVAHTIGHLGHPFVGLGRRPPVALEHYPCDDLVTIGARVETSSVRPSVGVRLLFIPAMLASPTGPGAVAEVCLFFRDVG